MDSRSNENIVWQPGRNTRQAQMFLLCSLGNKELFKLLHWRLTTFQDDVVNTWRMDWKGRQLQVYAGFICMYFGENFVNNLSKILWLFLKYYCYGLYLDALLKLHMIINGAVGRWLAVGSSSLTFYREMGPDRKEWVLWVWPTKIYSISLSSSFLLFCFLSLCY